VRPKLKEFVAPVDEDLTNQQHKLTTN